MQDCSGYYFVILSTLTSQGEIASTLTSKGEISSNYMKNNIIKHNIQNYMYKYIDYVTKMYCYNIDHEHKTV